MAIGAFGKRNRGAPEAPDKGVGHSQPAVGWRVWALRDGRLASWATRYVWEPGENVASCLVPPRPMGCIPARYQHSSEPPGDGCGCGFWAVFSPFLALERARSARGERNSVVGLILGWGSIALHGSEGFRAQRAEVVCLFSDWCWESPALSERRLGIRFHLALQTWRFRAVSQASSRLRELEQAARTYGVPVLSLESALTHGVLAEFGVGRRARGQIQGWVELSRAYTPRQSARADTLGQRRKEADTYRLNS